MKNEYNSEDVPELDTDCEIIWTKLHLVGNSTVYLCSYYRHHVSDEESINQFEISVMRASSINNASLVIGGDFNFPGWDWKTKSIKAGAAYTGLHHRFSDIIDNIGLVQIVEEPTLKNNVLDLILTNRPNKVLRVDVLPGVSDHDIVFTELDMRPVKQKQKPRQIPIYRKAEWEPMKEDMKSLHKDMEAMYNSTTGVNEMWEKFRDTLQHSINSHIPHRQSRSIDGYPWIGPELKKMMKQQHRYYKIKKKTGDPQHVEPYLDLKH